MVKMCYSNGSYKSTRSYDLNPTWGKVPYWEDTLILDTVEICNLLSIPDGLRDRDKTLFAPSQLVTVWYTREIGVRVPYRMSFLMKKTPFLSHMWFQGTEMTEKKETTS
jgi:hypothetical protein